MKDKEITVWFSCGAASAVAAKKTIELYGDTNRVRVVNNPIKEEHHDNQRFLKDFGMKLILKITHILFLVLLLMRKKELLGLEITKKIIY